jgi:lipoate-protein ligase B
VTTHGYALNVDLDPAPFTQWIGLRARGRCLHHGRARARRPVTVDEARVPALEALAEVFELELEELPADAGHGLWAQPVHAQLAARG